ncbi:hypothetical protein BCR44DRAFT_27731 [Catenaria anguillulae PL171]|uniref:Uncharacterized protein n=1 Tax=Catenaria anguillulae PL171 TaxID=765915 RepID=A0A1Y2HL40_9FUNG|nr:hypothetical protein BCR44DRAFT_27731 [Catenaria anguillulae PL171]
MSRTLGTPTPTSGTGPSTSQDPFTPNSPSSADQQTSPSTSVATPQQPNAQPYTSTAAITIVHPDFVDDDTAATIKLKPQVRFFFKERPEGKKVTVTDPEDPLFRPIVPETITLRFNIGPQNNLSNLKTIIYQAIRPVLGGRARLSAQSTWVVDPPSLVDLGHYVAIQDPTGKRVLWFWGTEIPPNHPKTHVAITGKWVAALKDKEIEALPTIICRYGYDLTEQGNYTSFYVAVLASQKKSRGGFPDSVVHNDIVARLREMWGTRYDALTADWQRWATELVRTPVHQLDSKMLFQTCPSASRAPVASGA